MTLAKAKANYEAAHPDGPVWAELTAKQQTDVLTAAVVAERAKRRG